MISIDYDGNLRYNNTYFKKTSLKLMKVIKSCVSKIGTVE